MMNMRLIEEAVRLVVDLFEAENIYEKTSAIRERAIDWYNRTEIVDARMLAAATITGVYQIGTSWDELLNWTEFYFPSIPIVETLAIIGGDDMELDMFCNCDEYIAANNFHIGEIEMAQRDFIWR